MEHELIWRRDLDAAALMKAHPLRLADAHKRKIHELAGSASGTIQCTRWAEQALPAELPATRPELVARAEVFDYPGNEAGIWHVNFADPHLFFAYGSSLLAQDELQALEHPALGAIRELMIAEGLPALTEEHDRATPVLVSGVERRFALDTVELYGNRFASAPFETVRRALTILDPPTRSNLIAMAAPVGSGVYARAMLERILRTAYTSFRAAALESRRIWPAAPVEVRTGFWGCGAFGGNRTVMVVLQLVAARLAGVDRVGFYTVTPAGIADHDAGVAAIPDTGSIDAMMRELEARRYAWGSSNGT